MKKTRPRKFFSSFKSFNDSMKNPCFYQVRNNVLFHITFWYKIIRQLRFYSKKWKFIFGSGLSPIPSISEVLDFLSWVQGHCSRIWTRANESVIEEMKGKIVNLRQRRGRGLRPEPPISIEFSINHIVWQTWSKKLVHIFEKVIAFWVKYFDKCFWNFLALESPGPSNYWLCVYILILLLSPIECENSKKSLEIFIFSQIFPRIFQNVLIFNAHFWKIIPNYPNSYILPLPVKNWAPNIWWTPQQKNPAYITDDGSDRRSFQIPIKFQKVFLKVLV